MVNVITGEIYPSEVDIWTAILSVREEGERRLPLPAAALGYDGEGASICSPLALSTTHMHVESTR